MRNITVNNQKFILLLVGMGCITLLMILKTIEAAVGTPILSGVILYAIGNGVAAKNGVDSRLLAQTEPEPEVI